MRKHMSQAKHRVSSDISIPVREEKEQRHLQLSAMLQRPFLLRSIIHHNFPPINVRNAAG